MRNSTVLPFSRLRQVFGLGMLVVVVGCAPGSGGCAPGEGAGTTTTVPGTTTTVDPASTTTTQDPNVTTTTEDPGSSTTTTTTTQPPDPDEPVRVEELSIEDCFSPVDADAFVDQVAIVDCSAPHQMEVFAEYELDRDADYPGGVDMTWDAKQECRARFDAYVGTSYWDSELDLMVLTPSFSTWDVGDRTITCLLVDPDGGPLTGAAKDSNR